MSVVVSNQPAIAPFDRHPADPNRPVRQDDFPREEPTTEEIAAVAYALFEKRGGEHGRDIDDWLEAERQIRATRFAS